MAAHRTRLSTDLAPRLLETSSPASPRTGEQGDSNWSSLRGSESEMATGFPSPTQTLIIRGDADTPSPALAPDEGRSEPEWPDSGRRRRPREEGSVHQEVWAGLTYHLLPLQGGRAPENQSLERLNPAQPRGRSPFFCPLLRHRNALNQLCTHTYCSHLPPGVLELGEGGWEVLEECQSWSMQARCFWETLSNLSMEHLLPAHTPWAWMAGVTFWSQPLVAECGSCPPCSAAVYPHLHGPADHSGHPQPCRI